MRCNVYGIETYEKPSHRGERVILLQVKKAKNELTARKYALRCWRGLKVKNVSVEVLHGHR